MITGDVRNRPLLKIAIPFLIGLSSGYQHPEFIPFWFVSAITLFFIILIFTDILKSRLAGSASVYFMLALSGFLYGQVDSNLYRYHPLHPQANEAEQVLFSARIIDEDFSRSDKRSHLARILYYTLDDVAYKYTGRVWLRLEGDTEVSYGTELIGRGVLKPIFPPRNPGDFDVSRYCRKQKIYSLVECDAENWKITGHAGNPLMLSVIIPLRKNICRAIDRHIGGDEGEILKGLVLGIRAGLESEFRRELRLSGLWHLLSLSGLHLGMAAGILFILLTALRVSGRWRWGIVILGLVFFCFLAEARAPMVRAAIIISFLFGSRYLNRYVDPWNLLALSALAIVLVKPGELFSVGFQLSFAAAGFILALAGRLYDGIRVLLPTLNRSPVLRYSTGLLAASLAASLGTAPFLAYHFGGIPLASIPASLIGVPLTGGLLMVFPLFLAAAAMHSIPAAIVGSALWGGVKLMKSLVRLSAESGLYLPTPDFTGWELLILEIPLLLLILGKRQWLWAGLLTANVFLWKNALEPHKCRVTFLDVGQGNAAVIELPGNNCLMVDAGPAHGRFNTGERVVVPFLEQRGTNRIERMILTHPDRDHIGGAESIHSRFPVDKVLVSPVHPDDIARFDVYPRYAGDWLKIGGALLMFFNPVNQTGDDNEESLVISLIFQGRRVLFTGDISSRRERELAIFSDMLESDILSVSHHGSKRSSSDDFLKAVSPRWAVISCGRANFYGHPAPEVLTRLYRVGAEIHRTDSDGAACFEISKRGIKHITWRKQY